MFRCPFCGKKLEIKELNTLCCDDCRLYVDLNRRTAYVIEDAPKHVLDTMKLLKLISKEKPAFVVGRHRAFDPKFDFDDIIISGYDCQVPDDYKLIAGGDFIVNNITQYIAHALVNGAESCPLVFDGKQSENSMLYMQVILESTKKDPIPKKVQHLVNFYAHPLLEYKAFYMIGGRYLAGADVLTEEQVLYALLFVPPQVNIVWSGDVGQLERNIYGFIRACLKDLDGTNINQDLKGSTHWELLKYAQSGILVNRINGDDCYYDILNHTSLKKEVDQWLAESVGREKLLIDAYKMLTDLTYVTFFKEDRVSGLFGIEAKDSLLKANAIDTAGMSVDERVLEFWKLMSTKVENKFSQS